MTNHLGFDTDVNETSDSALRLISALSDGADRDRIARIARRNARAALGPVSTSAPRAALATIAAHVTYYHRPR